MTLNQRDAVGVIRNNSPYHQRSPCELVRGITRGILIILMVALGSVTILFFSLVPWLFACTPEIFQSPSFSEQSRATMASDQESAFPLGFANRRRRKPRTREPNSLPSRPSIATKQSQAPKGEHTTVPQSSTVCKVWFEWQHLGFTSNTIQQLFANYNGWVDC